MDRSVRGVCSRAYIWKDFRFFYLVWCFVMYRLWWVIFHGGKEGIFFMLCCRQVLFLVSPRWLSERRLCLLDAICTRIRRYWMSSFCFWKKVYGCKFSVLWCPPLHWCNVWRSFCFYCGFVYNVFILAFSGRGHVFLTLQFHCCTVDGCDFLCLLFFNYLWHVACATVVFVKDFDKGAIIGEVLED